MINLSVRTPALLILGALSFATALAGCERPSAVRADAGPPTEGSTPYPSAADRGAGGTSAYADRSTARSPDRAAAPAPLLDGRPLWTSSRRGSAEENAQRAFARNGDSFGASSLEAYVRKARAFIDAPPAGAQRLTRRNGDVLLYHPASNTFAVASRDGAPRAFFHPDDGAAYWAEQKAREGRSRTARAGGERQSEG